MDVVEQEQLNADVAASHWYYDSKYALIKKHIDALGVNKTSLTTADVGTGIGLFLHKMEVDGYASPERSIGIDPAHQDPTTAFHSQIPIQANFPKDRNYDLLLMMDVLEHVEDDNAMLQDVIPHVKKDGLVFITVPALPMLWSSHDRFLGHYRRYTLKSLRKLVEDSGRLELVSLHYYFAVTLPLALPMRLMHRKRTDFSSSDMRPVSKIWNSVFKWICRCELPFAILNRFAGLTAVALCRKN